MSLPASSGPDAVPVPASRSGPTRPAGDPSRLAWQREMERAQSETWFRPGTHDSATAPRLPAASQHDGPRVPAGSQPPPPASLPVLAWQPPGRIASVPAGADERPPATPSMGAAVPPVMTDDGGLPSVPAPLQTTGRPGAAGPAAQAVAPSSTLATQRLLFQPADASSPVRMHVQWDPDGARVWIGVDAAQASRTPELAGLVVRWLTGQGHRVQRVVCNGKAVDTPPTEASVTDSPARLPTDVVVYLTTHKDD